MISWTVSLPYPSHTRTCHTVLWRLVEHFEASRPLSHVFGGTAGGREVGPVKSRLTFQSHVPSQLMCVAYKYCSSADLTLQYPAISRIFCPLPVISQHFDTMAAPQSLPVVPKYVRFRVLIIGRANAGKTSILQRVCDTTESPVIYRRDPSGIREQVRPCFLFLVVLSISSSS